MQDNKVSQGESAPGACPLQQTSLGLARNGWSPMILLPLGI